MDAAVKFEEYKLFSELVQRLSERRQVASQTYLAVNTAAFGLLAFLAKDAGFHGWGLVGVSVPLFLVGMIACVVWHSIITHFREIIGWHYEQLREMEDLEYEEIAEIMGTSLSAVESLIHRGMKNLKEKLSQYYGQNL